MVAHTAAVEATLAGLWALGSECPALADALRLAAAADRDVRAGVEYTRRASDGSALAGDGSAFAGRYGAALAAVSDPDSPAEVHAAIRAAYESARNAGDERAHAARTAPTGASERLPRDPPVAAASGARWNPRARKDESGRWIADWTTAGPLVPWQASGHAIEAIGAPAELRDPYRRQLDKAASEGSLARAFYMAQSSRAHERAAEQAATRPPKRGRRGKRRKARRKRR